MTFYQIQTVAETFNVVLADSIETLEAAKKAIDEYRRLGRIVVLVECKLVY